MTLATPLTPTGRLENASVRVSSLRQRLEGLAGRAHLSPYLRRDVDEIRNLLGGIDRAINEAVDRVLDLNNLGDEMSPQTKQLAYELTLDQDPWINYADSRLDAAKIAYLELGRRRQ